MVLFCLCGREPCAYFIIPPFSGSPVVIIIHYLRVLLDGQRRERREAHRELEKLRQDKRYLLRKQAAALAGGGHAPGGGGKPAPGKGGDAAVDDY